MFMEIEGDAAEAKTKANNDNRQKYAEDLWEVTCCFENIFNETSFKEA